MTLYTIIIHKNNASLPTELEQRLLGAMDADEIKELQLDLPLERLQGYANSEVMGRGLIEAIEGTT